MSFFKYYLAEFDVKFKDAWNETVVKIKQPEQESLNKNWEEFHYPEESKKTYDEVVKEGYEMTADGFWIPSQPSQKEDKVVKWQIPVEMDGPSGEYFITFPDDLLEAANLKKEMKLSGLIVMRDWYSFTSTKSNTKPLGMR